MADVVEKTKKTETSAAQNRFIVSLPKDVGEDIDRIGQRISNELKETTGVAFEVSRAQVVQGLVRSAIDNAEAIAGASE